jgi:hypothetical protein
MVLQDLVRGSATSMGTADCLFHDILVKSAPCSEVSLPFVQDYSNQVAEFPMFQSFSDIMSRLAQ